MAGAIQRDPKLTEKGEKPTATIVFREFSGMNTQSPRESIQDDEFYWLENAQPVGHGNLPILRVKGTAVGSFATGITGWPGTPPLYTVTQSYGGNDYVFALFAGEGLFQMNVVTGVVTKIANDGVFTSRLSITQWDNLGVLLVDPVAGYYDWNVTAANTLTAIAGGSATAVSSVTMTNKGSGYTSQPTVTFSGGGGTTQATGSANLGAASAAVAFAGGRDPVDRTGHTYNIGDVITALGGSYTTPASFVVSGVTSSGGITSVTVQNPGSYTSIPANPVSVSPGNATLNLTYDVESVTILTGGAGYTSAPGVAFAGGGGVNAAGTAVLGGAAGGQPGNAIATYAGRVWIANGRTITFTDVDKYNSFSGAGGSLTLSDSTLHKNITALFVANGYMFIFGDDSIDILSNVQVQAGVTSFSRINLTTSVGTTFQTSVFSYLRSILFASESGFYALSGSTPEKISNKLDGLLPYIDFSKGMYGFPIEINGILCAAFSFWFTDQFTTQYFGNYRPVLAIFFNSKWFIASQTTTSSAAVAVPLNGVYTGYLVDADGGLYPMFQGTTATTSIFQTKLWDEGEPILDKQSIRAGFGAVFQETATVSFTVDTEYGSYPSNLSLTANYTVLWVNNLNNITSWQNNANNIVSWNAVSYPSYQLLQGPSNAAKGKYMGISLSLTSKATIAAFALEYKTGARW